MMPAMNVSALPMSQGPMMMPGMGMPMMSMMPMMTGMGMPMMMPMMTGMGMPMMSGTGMMPGAGMPMASAMMPMMCRMTMEMGKDGMICKLMPMEGANMDLLRERCDAMTKMMASGMPMMMLCGGSMMMCTPAAK